MISANGGTAQPLENTNASDTNNELAWWPSSDIVYQQTGVRNYLRINDKTHEEKPIIQHDQSVGWVPVQTSILTGRQENGRLLESKRKGASGLFRWNRIPKRCCCLAIIYPVGWSPDGKYVYAIRIRIRQAEKLSEFRSPLRTRSPQWQLCPAMLTPSTTVPA